MREKHKFSRTLALSYVITTLIKITFSLFAFLSFESNNRSSYPKQSSRWSLSHEYQFHFCFILHSFISPAFSLSVPLAPINKDDLKFHFYNASPVFVFISNIVVLSTVLVAILLPKFALVVSFTGSICASFCSYIFPCAVHLKLKKLKPQEACLDVLLIVIGTVVLVLGVVFFRRSSYYRLNLILIIMH